MRLYTLIAICLLSIQCKSFASCSGNFVNPLTDVCWRCMFPLSIGGATVAKSSLGLKDTPNPASPIGVCNKNGLPRVGLQIGYWEPFSLVDVTAEPFCFVDLGGLSVASNGDYKRGGHINSSASQSHAFYHVHWYKYPLMFWLNLLDSVGCMQGGDFDVLWITEIDPLWLDSELAFIVNPESALFGSAAAQLACGADATSSTTLKKPLDSLFWCAGEGTHYPVTGHILGPQSFYQSSFLLAQRMNFKLHRRPLSLIADSNGEGGLDSSGSSKTCSATHRLTLPKSRYRYELVNQHADGKHCYPSGYSSMLAGASKIRASDPEQAGFLVWRKRNCTFL